MTSRRALCVGINVFQNYSGNNLQGCVNDANDMKKVLTKLLGFQDSDVTLLTDQQATKAEIMRQLGAMVTAAQQGKLAYLVFSLSSHGTQIAEAPNDPPDERDGYDEAFCPTDLAASGGQWDRRHIIVDDELHDLFVTLPPSVLLEVYLDTCHAGTGLKVMDLMPDRRPRYLAPPSPEAIERAMALPARGLPHRLRHDDRKTQHAILTAACRDNQTSADAYIGGAYHGAFTHYWCQEIMKAENRISRAELVRRVNQDLKSGHFSQVAQLECDATQRQLAVSPA